MEACRDYLTRILDNFILQNAEHSLSILELQERGDAFSVGTGSVLDMRLVVVWIDSILNVSKIQYCSDNLPYLIDFLLAKAYIAHTSHSCGKTLFIIDPLNCVVIRWAFQEAIVGGIGRCQLVFVSDFCGGETLVEYVERSLVLTDGDSARFLKQVGQNLGCLNLSRLRLHVHLDELTETGRVNIASCLCITEGLKQWI